MAIANQKIYVDAHSHLLQQDSERMPYYTFHFLLQNIYRIFFFRRTMEFPSAELPSVRNRSSPAVIYSPRRFRFSQATAHSGRHVHSQWRGAVRKTGGRHCIGNWEVFVCIHHLRGMSLIGRGGSDLPSLSARIAFFFLEDEKSKYYHGRL